MGGVDHFVAVNSADAVCVKIVLRRVGGEF